MERRKFPGVVPPRRIPGGRRLGVYKSSRGDVNDNATVPLQLELY